MIDMDITRKSLTTLDVDSHCLDELDRKFLLTLIEKFRMEEFHLRVKKLFCQPRKTMVDLILNKDGGG